MALALLDVIGANQRATLVGHDWGANLVWAMALRYPELVNGVIALSRVLSAARRRGVGIRQERSETMNREILKEASPAVSG